jgi:thiol-disulfide isomerase/thioredoxin
MEVSMSRRRLTALAALVVVPLAVLAIVLLSVGSDDDGDQGSSVTTGETAPPAAQQGSRGSPKPGPRDSRNSDSGGASAPTTSLPVLDKGQPPARGKDKLAPALSDGAIDLAKLRGSPVVLNVWSSSCIPCRGEARVLQSEWERYGPRGVLFLGLNVQDSAQAAKRFRSTFGVTYPAAAEKEAETAKGLGATSVPETFFLSESGKVVDHVVGAVSLADVELGIRAAQTGHRLRTSHGGASTPLD